jgi:L-lactate dehydrogenase complex protein LldG
VAVLDPAARGEERKERLQALEPAPVCLSGAACAIAESGTLVLRHGPGRPRLASLLAPTHIAVVRTEQLVRGLGEALARLRAEHGDALFDATSNLTLITGPSRTGDIEMTLALGIHGPPELHVILVGGPK